MDFVAAALTALVCKCVRVVVPLVTRVALDVGEVDYASGLLVAVQLLDRAGKFENQVVKLGLTGVTAVSQAEPRISTLLQ